MGVGMPSRAAEEPNNEQHPRPKSACGTLAEAAETPEEWWTRHASLLAEKMRRGGVRKFHVELTPRGTYVFEADPIESANPHSPT